MSAGPARDWTVDVIVQPEKAPPWFFEMVTARMAEVEAKFGHSVIDTTMMITPLAPPQEGASKEQRERWERLCDHCGKYVFSPEPIRMGAIRVSSKKLGTTVTITFGFCDACAP